MKTHIEIKNWKKDFRSVPSMSWKNINTGEVITERYSKEDGCFFYFDKNNKYLGRYNSDVSLFKDGLILIVLDSEY